MWNQTMIDQTFLAKFNVAALFKPWMSIVQTMNELYSPEAFGDTAGKNLLNAKLERVEF